MTFTVQCRNRRCRQKSAVPSIESQVVICERCGTGQRLRLQFSADGLSGLITLAPLEPQDEGQQAKSHGALR